MSARSARLLITAGPGRPELDGADRLYRQTPRRRPRPSRPPRSPPVRTDEPGKKVKIGFSAPACRPTAGWVAITKATKAEAAKYPGRRARRCRGAPMTSTSRSARWRRSSTRRWDAIVLLPFDGAALTAVATKAIAGRHHGDQRGPRVSTARSRPGPRFPRRQPRHGRVRGQVHLRPAQGQEGRRDRGDRRESTRCPLTQAPQ